MQKVVEKKPKRRRRRRGAAAGLQTLRANEPDDEESSDDDETARDRRPTPLLVYADFEAMQEGGLHTPNLICWEREDSDHQYVEYGADCCEAYLDWATHVAEHENRQVITVFHNFKGYDGMFVLRQLYDDGHKVTHQICIGSKILSLRTGDLKFVDSCCFIPQPLHKFPATFGLAELKKGFFPHFFNTAENQAYDKDEMPARDYYDPDGMMEGKRREFLAWYADRVAERYHFNFRQELEAYCKSDVRLLKEGCRRFQQEFEAEAGFNPFLQCITIASSCMRYFQKKWLLPDTIAVEPPLGWHGARNRQSVEALQWLHWCEQEARRVTRESMTDEEWQAHDLLQLEDPDYEIPGLPVADRIAHVGNRGEQRLRLDGRVFDVDGYDPVTHTAYEYHGCYFHGCPRCHRGHMSDKSRVHPDRTLRELYEATVAKETALRNGGVRLVTMWGCDWTRLKAQREDIRTCLAQHPIVLPLDPRDAFFGGRTNAAVLYATVDPEKGEQIRYVDVTSLYPWVNKYCEYPVGHPEIKTHVEGTDLSPYFGLAKVDVIPPPLLHHPVLPLRSGGKLTFPLCRTCVAAEQAKPHLLDRTWRCPHTPEQRRLTGTWCTPELAKAVELGYEIVRIHEVWHFPRRQTGLFAGYVNTWLKHKTEASGWPPGPARDPQHPECQAARDRFVANYLAREGVQLDPAQIVKNPGRKATAKLMLNSFWGKFGERLNKCQVEQVTSPARFYDLLRDESRVIHAVRVVNEEMLDVTYNYVDEAAAKSNRTNVFVAAFTTCHARLKLYSYLEHVGANALYFDTDSVIYKWWPGQPEIELGEFLGEMTDELEDPDDHICEFVSAGPKNYGYETHKDKHCCKSKGFTLNFRGSQQLNYGVLKANVLQELRDPLDRPRQIPVFNPHFITRDADRQLETVTQIKRYQLVFDKRAVDPNTAISYPYGYLATHEATQTRWADLQARRLVAQQEEAQRLQAAELEEARRQQEAERLRRQRKSEALERRRAQERARWHRRKAQAEEEAAAAKRPRTL